MAERILVPLTSYDRVDDLIPYLQNVARPGAKVIFLVPSATAAWRYAIDHWIAAESPRSARLEAEEIFNRYSWDKQRAEADQRLSTASEALRKRGVEAAVEIYSGALKKTISRYMADREPELIVMRDSMKPPVFGRLRGVGPWLRSLRRADFPSMLLLFGRHFGTY
ncbi:MAG TPA: hypothetical protein VNN77_03025 [candidate division Zixibacteria bacterium]|nr:hypothetical protein [candidate division Zixibacteria bacterium]